jgi:Spy/CpxP family protein refolding chaperone
MMKAFTNKLGKSRALIILAVVILVFAAGALAQGPGGPAGRGPGSGEGEFGYERRLERLTARLELSDEQAAAIAAIGEQGREEGLKLRKEMMRLRNELEGEMLKDEPSEAAVVDLVDKIGNLKTEMHKIRVKNRLQVRRQLTPEQRDKMLMHRGGLGQGLGRKGGHSRGPRFGHGFGHEFGHECNPDCSGPGRGQRGRRI